MYEKEMKMKMAKEFLFEKREKLKQFPRTTVKIMQTIEIAMQ